MSESLASKKGLPLRVKMRHSSHFVDELTARQESSVGKFVPLSSLAPNRNQPRVQMGDLSDLVTSVRDKGILEPILVRRSDPGTESSEGRAAARYSIVAGERRYRAALEAGLFEVPVIELEVSSEEALEIALIENLQRKDLTAFEEAEGYRALGSLHSYTQEQIGKAIGKARSTVAEALALLEIPIELRERADRLGIQSRSALLAIAKAGSPEAMAELLEQAGRLGLSRDQLRKGQREKSSRAGRTANTPRRSPYVFRFRAPDKTYTLNLAFRQSVVERDDLIRAVEQILQELRRQTG